MPTMMPTSAGKMMRMMPKIMQIIARTGRETVMPIRLKPFSTASVKNWFPPPRNSLDLVILRLLKAAIAGQIGNTICRVNSSQTSTSSKT